MNASPIVRTHVHVPLHVHMQTQTYASWIPCTEGEAFVSVNFMAWWTQFAAHKTMNSVTAEVTKNKLMRNYA